MSYRKVGNSSEVEDALFGFGSGTMGRAGRSIISADQLTAIRTGGRISNTAVINSADLDRMKRSTLILSTDQIRDNEEQREAGLAVKRAASNARKARVIGSGCALPQVHLCCGTAVLIPPADKLRTPNKVFVWLKQVLRLPKPRVGINSSTSECYHFHKHFIQGGFQQFVIFCG